MAVPVCGGLWVWQGATSVCQGNLNDRAADECTEISGHRATILVDPVLLEQVHLSLKSGCLTGGIDRTTPGIDTPMDVVGRYCERIVHTPTLRRRHHGTAPLRSTLLGVLP